MNPVHYMTWNEDSQVGFKNLLKSEIYHNESVQFLKIKFKDETLFDFPVCSEKNIASCMFSSKTLVTGENDQIISVLVRSIDSQTLSIYQFEIRF